MWDTIDEEMGKLNGKAKGENLKDNVEGIALGRIETPEDVAGVVSFFASDNADYVTGQTLLVDGGMLYNRSEEHTSELQSRGHLVCRLLLEKKKNKQATDDKYTRKF